MVGHHARSDERYSGEVHILVQELKLNRSIGIAVQDEAPPVAALRDMVWDTHCDRSVESAHDRHDNSSDFAHAETSAKMNEPQRFPATVATEF
jgi:hypothetical protein